MTNSPAHAPEPETSVREISRLADRYRLRALDMLAPLGFGYLGQTLSSAELVATLYSGHYRHGTDDLVCSPGHYAIAFYAAAAEAGRLSDERLATYGLDDSDLEAIGTERSPEMDLIGGSLAQGLSGAVGFALSARLRGDTDKRVFALISDGELEEGQLWEAALFASHHKLDNIVAFLDANDSQVDGPVSSVTTIEPVRDKWEAFGWRAFDIDGHDPAAIDKALQAALEADGPAILIGRTSPRHGLACLPDDVDSHFIKLPADLLAAARRELADRVS
jgi:transketolase